MVHPLTLASQGLKCKFGAEVARLVTHAFYLDKVNGNTLWHDAIQKELKQINDYKNFWVLQSLGKIPESYQKIKYHIVFDVKYDLLRKAHLVAGGNETELEPQDVFSGL